MNIEEIRDIVRVINKYESFENLPLDFKKLFFEDSKLAEFYQVLKNDEIRTDEEARSNIYPGLNSSGRYKSLKSYFVSRAMNSITLLDLNKGEFSELTQAIYKSYKYLFIIAVLLSLGSRSGAMHFAKKLLKLTEKFELHIISVMLFDELRIHSLQLGDEVDFNRFRKLSDKKVILFMNESRIKSLEEQIRIHFTKSLFVDEAFKMQAANALEEANIIINKCDTYAGRISHYRLQYMVYQMEGRLNKSLEACDEALKYLKSKTNITPPARYAEFGLYQLENYILLQDYVNGKKAARFCIEHTRQGLNLWFKVKELEFILLMQTLKFEDAKKIHEEVTTNERFPSQLEHLKERWEIFGIHVEYTNRIKRAATNQNNIGVYKKSYLRRSRKFKSLGIHSPSYKKDKRGFNVALLILNILVSLEDGRDDLLIEQEEALSSYRFQYLNVKHSEKSFILLKLIKLMIRNQFDLKTIEKKSSLIEISLKQSTLRSGEVFEYIQILPPEWIWNRIKTILSSRTENKSK